MSSSGWAAALLLGAAVTVGWPATGRARWRFLRTAHSRDGRAAYSPDRFAAHPGDGSGVDGPESGPGDNRRGAPLSPLTGGLSRPLTALIGVPRRLTALTGVTAGLTGAVAAGPVAGVIAAVYLALAAHLVLRQRAVRVSARQRRDRLDGVSALAADLRAGLPVPIAAAGLAGTAPGAGAGDRLGLAGAPAGAEIRAPGGSAGRGRRGGTRRGACPDRVDELVRAAGRLADRTGAPLADLLERIEADARATDRGLAAAAAQAAGARATAWLLALLPLGGIGLGFGIGVDPLEVLLHTPAGAACAIAALLLQLGGLAWSDRLHQTSGQVR